MIEDRFICRREGHEPAIKLTRVSGMSVTLTVQCLRCGKFYEQEEGERED